MKETVDHIIFVRGILSEISNMILSRGVGHDKSKLESPEAEIFEKFTPLLKQTIYGSDEYRRFLVDMKPAVDHHYANNRHHPEHFVDGIDGMNLIDLVEMIVDWKAASLRHDSGDVTRSIDVNVERFGISPQLKRILINTVELIDGVIDDHRRACHGKE